MTVSSYLELPLRSETAARELRELHRAKLLAADNYQAIMSANTAGLSPDERIDLSIRTAEVQKAFEAACIAIYRAEARPAGQVAA